jgi:hypothetical protein
MATIGIDSITVSAAFIAFVASLLLKYFLGAFRKRGFVAMP